MLGWVVAAPLVPLINTALENRYWVKITHHKENLARSGLTRGIEP
jgi:hypothetical protein